MSAARVLVTGGAGYIGSHVVLALLDAGRAVVVADDLSSGVRDAVPTGVDFHRGNIGDQKFVSELFDRHSIGAVMHLAGSISAPQSIVEPLEYYRNNACASLSLAENCVQAGVDQFIFSSSAAVYGACGTSPIDEASDARPVSPYGASKLMTETMLADLAAARPTLRAVSLRYFNVAGADPDGRAGHRGPRCAGLVPAGIEAALGLRPELPIFGDDYATRDGTCERDYIHVSDLAAAHVSALKHLEAGGAGGVMNCGYGRGHTVLEVVAALEAAVGHQLPTARKPRRPGDVARAVCDSGRLRRTLDWNPLYDNGLGAIIQTALAWRSSLPSA